MRTASPADCDQIQAIAIDFLASVIPLFPETDRNWHGQIVYPHQTLATLQLDVLQFPSDEDRRLVNVPAPRGLYGLHDPARDLVRLFATDIQSSGMDPRRVVWHELGHAVYDNPDHPSSTTDDPDADEIVVAEDGRTFTDDCPVCNVFDRSAVAYALVLEMDKRSLLYHRIPPGWEGVIPLARHRLSQAQEKLSVVGPLLHPEDAWMASELESRIAEAQWALSGRLSVEDLGPATIALYSVLDAAGDVTGAFYGRRAQERQWTSSSAAS